MSEYGRQNGVKAKQVEDRIQEMMADMSLTKSGEMIGYGGGDETFQACKRLEKAGIVKYCGKEGQQYVVRKK